MPQFGRSSGGTARSSSSAVAGPFSEDRHVEIRVHGDVMQRIGFSQDDVAESGTDNPDRGFILLGGETLTFILTAGDSIWANGDSDSSSDTLSILITQVGA